MRAQIRCIRLRCATVASSPGGPGHASPRMPLRVAVDLDLAVAKHRRPLFRSLRQRQPSIAVEAEAEAFHAVSVALHGSAAPLIRARALSGVALLGALLLSAFVNVRLRDSPTLPAGLAALWTSAFAVCGAMLWTAKGGATPPVAAALAGGGGVSSLIFRLWASLMLCCFVWGGVASLAEAARDRSLPSRTAIARALAAICILGALCLTAPHALIFLLASVAALALASLDASGSPARDIVAGVLLRMSGDILPGGKSLQEFGGLRTHLTIPLSFFRLAARLAADHSQRQRSGRGGGGRRAQRRLAAYDPPVRQRGRRHD